jgi:hypothetical protein
MTNRIWTGHFLNVQEAAQRHHPTGTIAFIHSLNLARIRPEIGVTLQIDLKRSAQQVKVIDIVRAKVALECRENRVQRDTQGLDLFPVDIQIELWYLRTDCEVRW